MLSKAGEPALCPVLAAALTHVHVGIGRSPGIVDLPVVRDPLGFFYIPGSSFKGAIKSTIALLRECIEGDRISCVKDNKDECKRLCCLLGGDVEEASETPSRLSIGDLYPLLIPVPSLSHGFLYATSPALIARAKTVQEAAANNGNKEPLYSLLEKLEKGAEFLSEGKDAVLLGASSDSTVLLGITKINAEAVEDEGLDEVSLGNISSVYTMHPLKGYTIIVRDELMPLIIERSLVRLTRIRLDRSKKTVATGMLWTEEYIPQFTLFVGYIADTGHSNAYCSKINTTVKELLSLLNASDCSFTVVVGGKETVGKGLLRVKVLA